jgi:pyruvate,water dikinase
MIHGQVASVGDNYYFRGTARVVHSISEIGKIQEGDVLVAPMTSPDYVIGMKKAGAIITDVGGMLSHAAIVSRELKKPCIVGTQFATEVIKNGDVVELHCGKGTVRIIKHAQ